MKPSRRMKRRSRLTLARDFDKAVSILEPHAEDPPSAILIERCRAFQQMPPPEDWCGVYVSMSK